MHSSIETVIKDYKSVKLDNRQNGNKNLDNTLKHYGVKGMKWGVRKDQMGLSNIPGPASRARKAISSRIESSKRKKTWKQSLKDLDNMSTKDIQDKTNRLRLENDLERLSKSKVANKKDRQDFLKRGNMSNQELSRKVTRLRAKDNMLKAVEDANSAQAKVGKRVTQASSSLAMKAAVTKSITPKDIFNAARNPNKVKSETAREIDNIILERLDRN